MPDDCCPAIRCAVSLLWAWRLAAGLSWPPGTLPGTHLGICMPVMESNHVPHQTSANEQESNLPDSAHLAR